MFNPTNLKPLEKSTYVARTDRGSSANRLWHDNSNEIDAKHQNTNKMLLKIGRRETIIIIQQTRRPERVFNIIQKVKDKQHSQMGECDNRLF
ncbi:hypothetical protein HZS_7437 [Henneguya salminicola]|nr:hypothetical protein HZS_7437 [Henneguya salminicola]